MRHSVTTPGGFFIGVGGIIASLLVAFLVFWLVKSPAPTEDLRVPQAGLGLMPAKDEKSDEKIKEIKAHREATLAAAAARYNGGKTPNINDLEDLRGLARMKESDKALAAAEATLSAPSNQNDAQGKPLPVLTVAMAEVVKDIQAKKPAPSAVPADPIPAGGNAPSLPNLMGSGVHTVTFPAVLSPPPAAPAPATPAAPTTAPAKADAGHGDHATPAPATPAPATPAPAPAPTPASAPHAAVEAHDSHAIAAAPEPSRPPLLNGNEPTK